LLTQLRKVADTVANEIDIGLVVVRRPLQRCPSFDRAGLSCFCGASPARAAYICRLFSREFGDSAPE